MDLIKFVENEFKVEKEHPIFSAGDTVTVSYMIREGNKERIQNFRGVVLQINGPEIPKHLPFAKCREALELKGFSRFLHHLSKALK
jgi:ribosomal protein L19